MAKGSPFTTFTGKLGQIVGFIIKSAASKQVQGMRAYQPNVSNPKTVLQANQRLCLKPLNNFARALAPVIGRGFENVKYGAESRREFMRINMTSFNGPYLHKGVDDPVPGPFVIGKGSLVPVAVVGTSRLGADGGYLALTDLYMGQSMVAWTTIGVMSADLIDKNSDVRDGDQLTFVACYNVSGQYIYRTNSLVIDSTSTEAITHAEDGTAIIGDLYLSRFVLAGESFSAVRFGIGSVDVSEVLCGAAVIQSREGVKGEHLRSDASMWVSPGVYDVWFSQEQYEAALASYMGDQAIVDWPVQQTAESAVVLQDSVSVHVPVAALSSTTQDQYPNGIDVLGYVMSDGTVGVWVDTSAMYLLDMLGRRISWLVSDTTAYAQLISTDAFPWKYYFGGVVSA